MKKATLFALPLLALALLFGSCSKDDDSSSSKTLNLEVSHEQVQGWLNLTMEDIDAQLTQLGYTRQNSLDNKAQDFTYYKGNQSSMTGYVCHFELQNDRVSNISVFYEAPESLGTTINTFKKYAELQNQKYTSPLAEVGVLQFRDGEDVDSSRYFYNYPDFSTALSNVGSHDYLDFAWYQDLQNCSVGTGALFFSNEDFSVMMVGVIATKEHTVSRK